MISLLPDELAPRFQEHRLLGQGSFGRVVYAVDTTLDREVAIKILDPRVDGTEHLEERFLREAKLTAGIKSPFVTQVYDYGVAAGQPYIVFQYVDGPSLGQRLRDRGAPLSVPEAAGYLMDILEGLVAAHEVGVIHRDLKPDNILLAPEGKAMVADFGLGKGRSDRKLTSTGMVVGTGEYMAPDQMRGDEPAPDFDLYAAGVIFYKLLVGRPPFVAETFVDMFELKMDGARTRLREEGVDVPEAVDHVLDRLLAPAREDRARSARMALVAFRSAFSRAGVDGVVSYPDLAARPILEESQSRPRSFSATMMISRLSESLPAVSLRARMYLVVSLLLCAGMLGFALAPRPPPRPRPLASPSVRPDRSAVAVDPLLAAARRDLADLRRYLDTHAQVREALTLADEVDSEASRARWEEARAVLREQAHRVADVVERLRDQPLRVGDMNHVTALALLQELLSNSRFEDVEPLFPAGQDPGLDALVARGIQSARAPRLSGSFPGAWKARQEAYTRLLGATGSEWRRLRGLERLLRTRDGEEILMLEVWRLDYYGDPFVESARRLPPEFRDGARSLLGIEDAPLIPRELDMPVVAPPGDLVLAMTAELWDRTACGLLEVKGRDETARFLLRGPTPEGGIPPAGEVQRQGVLVRVRREALPEGRRGLRLTFRGLQDLGNPALVVKLEEVFQWVGGPMPAGLEGGGR